MVSRASHPQAIDTYPRILVIALEALGNTGWNWKNLFKYIKKAEECVTRRLFNCSGHETLNHIDFRSAIFSFTAPYRPYAKENNLTYTAAYHGTSGPIDTSFPAFISGAQLPWEDALSKLGFPILKDAVRNVSDEVTESVQLNECLIEQAGGNDVGAWYSIANIDNTTKTRSYAATVSRLDLFSKTSTQIDNDFQGYYQPVASRSNLKLITSAFASRIVTVSGAISTSSGATVKATGVEYYIGTTKYTAQLAAGGEVIVSAG